MKIVKMPTPMRMVWGSVMAYWLAGVIHPAFVAIAVMIALFVPILINEYSFSAPPNHQPDINRQPHQSGYVAQKPVSRRLMDEDKV
ncbi:MAG: hypothetical protein Q7T96_11900 [Methylobacter sp.]|nr:hypothetical protein [Methylobacter sp.]